MIRCSKCSRTDVKFYRHKKAQYKRDGRIAHAVGDHMQPCADCKNKAQVVYRARYKQKARGPSKPVSQDLSSWDLTLGFRGVRA